MIGHLNSSDIGTRERLADLYEVISLSLVENHIESPLVIKELKKRRAALVKKGELFEFLKSFIEQGEHIYPVYSLAESLDIKTPLQSFDDYLAAFVRLLEGNGGELGFAEQRMIKSFVRYAMKVSDHSPKYLEAVSLVLKK